MYSYPALHTNVLNCNTKLKIKGGQPRNVVEYQQIIFYPPILIKYVLLKFSLTVFAKISNFKTFSIGLISESASNII